ncbi:MAG: hypothetical protein ACI8W8_002149 [Rhodothermales bacterium]|jgi:hypothetical protein
MKLVTLALICLAITGCQSTKQDWSYKSSNYNVTTETLHGGKQEGVKLIHVDNGKLKFTVIPTRGMSVLSVESGDVKLGWNSPIKEIVHPAYMDLEDRGGLGWLDGFNEAMVRCGVASAGHPGEDGKWQVSLHGKIGNIPASEVSVTVDKEPPYRIRVRGRVDERTFKFAQFELWTEISTVPGSNTVSISDTLHNRSEYENEYQIIYHANYGAPLLEKDAVFVAPVKEITPFDDYAAKDMSTWTQYLGPTRDYGEQVYCIVPYAGGDGRTTTMLHNAAGDRGVAMNYAVDSLPFFTLWKNTDTASDGYVTGLEPGSGYPYTRASERESGRVPKIAGGGEKHFSVKISILPDAAAVSATKAEIKEVQAGRPTTTNNAPQ